MEGQIAEDAESNKDVSPNSGSATGAPDGQGPPPQRPSPPPPVDSRSANLLAGKFAKLIGAELDSTIKGVSNPVSGSQFNPYNFDDRRPQQQGGSDTQRAAAMAEAAAAQIPDHQLLEPGMDRPRQISQQPQQRPLSLQQPSGSVYNNVGDDDYNSLELLHTRQRAMELTLKKIIKILETNS